MYLYISDHIGSVFIPSSWDVVTLTCEGRGAAQGAQRALRRDPWIPTAVLRGGYVL